MANFGSNNVSAFTIDPRTGALTAVGVPVISGASPSSLAVEPTGRFAYVTNRNSSSVSVFAINPNTGALAAAGLLSGWNASPQGFNSANRFALALLQRGVLRRSSRAPQQVQIFRSIEGAVQKTSSKRRKS